MSSKYAAAGAPPRQRIGCADVTGQHADIAPAAGARIVVLVGGVGGARFLQGVRELLPDAEVSAIVNVGAVVGFRGFPGDVAYGSAKAGLSGLTQVLAAELAPRNIRVNLVIPGFVDTDMTSGLSDRARARVVSSIPAGRTGQPEEIAQVVVDVALATYMYGAIVPVDGGLMNTFSGGGR